MLPALEVAALRELGIWAAASFPEVCSNGGGSDEPTATAAGAARQAAAVLQSLHGWAAALLRVTLAVATRRAAETQAQPQQPAPAIEGSCPAPGGGREGRAERQRGGEPSTSAPGSPQAGGARPEEPPGSATPNGSAEAGAPVPGEEPAAAAAAGGPGAGSAAAATGSASAGAARDGPSQERLRSLLGQAQRFPLLPAGQRELLAGLRASPDAVLACRPGLDEYRGLVEHNPLVAAWVSWGPQQAGLAGLAAALPGGLGRRGWRVAGFGAQQGGARGKAMR